MSTSHFVTFPHEKVRGNGILLNFLIGGPVMRTFKGERERGNKMRGGGGFPLDYRDHTLVIFEFSFVKNIVCEIFNGIEGDVFHELFEFMLGYVKVF